MHIHPPPDARDLLPPLLACLPTGLVASRPPPSLLPLLSPVLRQRISYLSGDPGGDKSWLSLLSWDTKRADKLPSVVERIDLEPHPVSGELEIEDVPPAKFQRLDEETFHARLEVEQFDLLPIYVWCEKDEHGGTEPGWKLAELRALEDAQDGTQWFESQLAATEAAVSVAPSVAPAKSPANGNSTSTAADEDDNDDYWAAYDRTPGTTPAPATKPNPHPTNGRQMADAQYFARYGAEVQPALDSHDPDEDHEGLGASTLRGDSILNGQDFGAAAAALRQTQQQPPSLQAPLYAPQATHLDPHAAESHDHLSMPRPISPTSSHSSVERLEEQAAAMSAQDDRAQRGIKMHISTDLKSLFRLAKSSGMSRAEFEEVVRRELDVLSLLEDEV